MQSHQEIESYTVQKQAPKPGGRKDVRRGKNDRYCDHCKVKGHWTDQCFKLYGYLEWYKEKYGSKMKIAAHIDTQATPLDHPVCSPEESPMSITPVNAVCQQVIKVLRGMHPSENTVGTTPSSTEDGFAGNVTIFTSFIDDKSMNSVHWIVDTGASDHISYQISMLTKKGNL